MNAHDRLTKSCIALTRELIKIPSESSNHTTSDHHSPERHVVDYLSSLCRRHKIAFKTQEVLPDRNNFIAHFPSPQKPTLLILAHMDTVSAIKVKNPFSANIAENKIWGRGACDDKGPLAAALSTLLYLTDEQHQLKYDVTFAATVDEECSMSGAAALRRKFHSFDLCIGLEPTDLKIVKAHKGVYRCKISTKGRAAHSSEPEKGKNAIIAMADILTDLQRFEVEFKKLRDIELGKPSLAITQIHGGSSVNIIPEDCEISVDIRLLPSQNPKEVAQSIKHLVGSRGKVADIFSASGIKTKMDSPHIKLFQQALTSNNLSPEPTTVSYATDCSQLHEIAPCIVWGPGHIDQAHKPDEHIAIDQLHQACRILTQFLTA